MDGKKKAGISPAGSSLVFTRHLIRDFFSASAQVSSPKLTLMSVGFPGEQSSWLYSPVEAAGVSLELLLASAFSAGCESPLLVELEAWFLPE